MLQYWPNWPASLDIAVLNAGLHINVVSLRTMVDKSELECCYSHMLACDYKHRLSADDIRGLGVTSATRLDAIMGLGNTSASKFQRRRYPGPIRASAYQCCKLQVFLPVYL